MTLKSLLMEMSPRSKDLCRLRQGERQLELVASYVVLQLGVFGKMSGKGINGSKIQCQRVWTKNPSVVGKSIPHEQKYLLQFLFLFCRR